MSRKLLAILILSLLPLLARAQNVTGNQSVYGKVSDDGWGLVTWYKGSINNIQDGKNLSFTTKSFLHLKINGLYYSNNNLGSTKIGPPEFDTKRDPDVPLDNGTNAKIGDTIETIWRQGGFDIVQDVYPVQFSHSGQIVVKWKIVNHSNAGIGPIESDYLLDIDPQNDKAKVLTRYDYSPKWRLYPNASNGVPPFFMAFQHAPDDPNGGFPGLTGTSYVTNEMTPTPMGLIAPSKLVVGAWTDLSYFKWGYPDNRFGQNYDDNAVLYQWPLTGATPKTANDSITTIATLSYGTGEFCENYGATVPVYTMLLQPGPIQYDGKTRQYAPNPFTVEAIVFNLSATTTLYNSQATLTTNSPLSIVSGTSEVKSLQKPLSPTSIAPFDIGDAVWTVKMTPTIDTVTFKTAYLSLDVNHISWADQWLCPLFIPIDMDTLPPLIGSLSVLPHSLSLTVRDDRATDVGLKSIGWTGTNVNVPITGGAIPISGCSPATYSIAITQIDTTKPACVTLTFTDCASNTSTFDTCLVSNRAADIYWPAFTYRYGYKLNSGADSNNRCNYQCTEWSLKDDQQFDRGLSDVKVKSSDNMMLTVDGQSPDSKAISFNICALEATQNGFMVLEAVDSAGHIVDTSFTYCAAVLADVGGSARSDLSLRAYPNPTTGACTLAVPGTATIEVLDVLGRAVDRFTMTESREWDMSALPAGTYTVRANVAGSHISTRVIKE